MLHGFSAGSAYNYKMVPLLRDHFECIMIDTFGQANSGRPNIETTFFIGCEDTVDFFVEKIRQYTVACGHEFDKADYYLLGHSMGCIFGSNFAIRFPQRIKGLIQLSPVGIAETPNQRPQEELSCIEAVGKDFSDRTWQSMSINAIDMFRIFGYRMSRSSIRKDVITRVGGDTLYSGEQEVNDFTDYSLLLQVGPKSTENCAYKIMKPVVPPAYSFDPICRKASQFSMPVCFVYGEQDWVTCLTAQRLVESGRLKPGSRFKITARSGHHLYMEAAPEICETILAFKR